MPRCHYYFSCKLGIDLALFRILNTLLYTVGGTLYNLFLLLPCAYAMAKRGLKGKGLLMGLFVFTMYFSGGMIPFYLVVKQLGLTNTPWVLILPDRFAISYIPAY